MSAECQTNTILHDFNSTTIEDEAKSVDMRKWTEEVKSVDERNWKEEAKSVDMRKWTEEIKSVDERNWKEEDKSVDVRKRTEETKSEDLRKWTEEAKSVVERNRIEEAKSVDNENSCKSTWTEFKVITNDEIERMVKDMANKHCGATMLRNTTFVRFEFRVFQPKN
eukprot:sb/3472507/